MADGGGPPRKRGKRSQIGDQCAWAMAKEIEATRIKPEGFILLKAPDLVKRVKAWLTDSGMPEEAQPDCVQIRRWQVEKIKELGL
jgi:hypothetical protein